MVSSPINDKFFSVVKMMSGLDDNVAEAGASDRHSAVSYNTSSQEPILVRFCRRKEIYDPHEPVILCPNHPGGPFGVG